MCVGIASVGRVRLAASTRDRETRTGAEATDRLAVAPYRKPNRDNTSEPPNLQGSIQDQSDRLLVLSQGMPHEEQGWRPKSHKDR
jgi:hypothetical protein